MDPVRHDRMVSTQEVQLLRTFLREYIPELADAPIVDSRICFYHDTLDYHFWIDRHPEIQNLTIACGGSGSWLQVHACPRRDHCRQGGRPPASLWPQVFAGGLQQTLWLPTQANDCVLRIFRAWIRDLNCNHSRGRRTVETRGYSDPEPTFLFGLRRWRHKWRHRRMGNPYLQPRMHGTGLRPRLT